MRGRRERKSVHVVKWDGAAQSQRCAGKERDAERRRKAGRKRKMKLRMADTENDVRRIKVEVRTT